MRQQQQQQQQQLNRADIATLKVHVTDLLCSVGNTWKPQLYGITHMVSNQLLLATCVPFKIIHLLIISLEFIHFRGPHNCSPLLAWV